MGVRLRGKRGQEGRRSLGNAGLTGDVSPAVHDELLRR
jgi:hypothetical protein